MSVQNVIDCLQSAAIVILAIACHMNRGRSHGVASPTSSCDPNRQTVYVQTTIREDALEDTTSDSLRDRNRVREEASKAAYRFALQSLRGDTRGGLSSSAGASNE